MQIRFGSVDTNCHRRWITAPVTLVLVLCPREGQKAFQVIEPAVFRGFPPIRLPNVSWWCNNLGNIAAVLVNSFPSSRRPKRTVQPSPQAELRRFYRTLHGLWGGQNWWPAATALEMIVGAFLTQNTAWTNVEKAMVNLPTADALSLNALREIEIDRLEQLVRSAGYFRQKSARLKAFVRFLDERYAGSLDRMLAEPTHKLRSELLELNGVGPETADSILLYAGNHPVFVVDAYTRRILYRHGLVSGKADYEEIRELWQASLKLLTKKRAAPSRSSRPSTKTASHRATHPPSLLSGAPRSKSAQVFNEMHALIVEVGKQYCRKSQPLCEQCPLAGFLPTNGPKSLEDPL
jgi:endonuclease III related protein